MKKGILGTHTVMQVGLLVNDIEKTARVYADFLGLPMPKIQVTDVLEKSQAKYRGSPTPARAKLAFLKVGDNLDLELIEPDHEPSTWREDLDKKGECVHHIAFVVKGMKEKIAALGAENMPLVQSGEYTGGRYAYIDANKDLKVLIELLEND
ncbi:MAG TPA: VOC family protein [Candidatus Baltobacteraceae bacterium]|nr:VOC family protein [Spirochaetia bacterium]HTX53400.1 VOC family protein [Candidatus Baltobacteraceae bacterium]